MKKYSIIVLWALLTVACGGGGDVSEGVTIKKDHINIVDKINLLGDGDSKDVAISATCNWMISEPDGWLTISPMKGDRNTKSITFTASRNTTGVARTTSIAISGGEAQTVFITVTQQRASDNQESSTGEPSPNDNQPPT